MSDWARLFVVVASTALGAQDCMASESALVGACEHIIAERSIGAYERILATESKVGLSSEQYELQLSLRGLQPASVAAMPTLYSVDVTYLAAGALRNMTCDVLAADGNLPEDIASSMFMNGAPALEWGRTIIRR